MNLSPGSSLGMSDVAAAIEEVASGSDEQFPLLEPGSSELQGQSWSPRTTRRSRTSSRTSLVPHNVRDEELPPDRFHDPAVQQAFRDARVLMSGLTDVLGTSSLHIDPDSTIRRLHQQADNLARFQCPSTRTVGFVGDSGVGMCHCKCRVVEDV
jgi:hypothetical protein